MIEINLIPPGERGAADTGAGSDAMSRALRSRRGVVGLALALALAAGALTFRFRGGDAPDGSMIGDTAAALAARADSASPLPAQLRAVSGDSTHRDAPDEGETGAATAARLRALEDFERSRSELPDLLALVAEAIPDDVRLVGFTTLASDPLSIELNGRAADPEGLIDFVERLRAGAPAPRVALLAARSVREEVPGAPAAPPVALLAFDLSLAGSLAAAAPSDPPAPGTAPGTVSARLAALEARLAPAREPDDGLPAIEQLARRLGIVLHGLEPAAPRSLDVHRVEAWALQVVGPYRAIVSFAAGIGDERLARVASASLVPAPAPDDGAASGAAVEATLVVERVVAGDGASTQTERSADDPAVAAVPRVALRMRTPRDPFAVPPAHAADAPDPAALRLEGIAWDPDPRRRLALLASGPVGSASPPARGRVRALRVGDRWGEVRVLAIRGSEAEVGIRRLGVVERRVLHVQPDPSADRLFPRGPR